MLQYDSILLLKSRGVGYMYDINIKNVSKGKSLFYIFFLAGLFFLVLIGWIYISSISKLKSLDSSVTSTNVEVKSYINDEGTTMYSPVYSYVVNGKTYTCGSNSSSSVNPGNSNKTVYYDSKNPSSCMTEYSKSENNIILIFILIPIIFIIVAVVNIVKVNKRIKTIFELNQKGKLVKNLPYRLENTGTVVNGVPIKMPVVDYVLPNGCSITLYGDARHDKKTYDSDGMVDLLIDENNPENYFIDFEINRISGNLPQDYYQQNTNSNVENNSVQNQSSNNQNTNLNNFNQQTNNQNTNLNNYSQVNTDQSKSNQNNNNF
jgi:hypothetical protein